MSTLADAIKALAPGAKFGFENDDINTLTWFDDSIPRPTNADILSKKVELDALEPMKRLRLERNRLLQETDWVAGDDVPQSLKDLYSIYRQALRDITNTYSSLDDVVWPTKPE